MPLQSNALFFLGGASIVAYLAYEYKEKLQLTKKFKTALADVLSGDIETQIISIETLVGYIASNKAFIKDLCDHGDALRELPQLIFSDNEEAQIITVELLALISQDEKALDAIRHNNLFQPLVAILSFPFASDDLLEGALVAIKNCTTLQRKTILHPSTGQPVKVPVDQIPRARSGNEEYDREEEWFARELYQQHGLEPLINKLLSEDPEIQSLALEIIINFCKTLKDQDEIGELGGVGFMLEIFTSKITPPPLQSLALSALRHCVQSCTCNVEQFRKSGGIKVLVLYFKNEAPKTTQGSDKEEDVFNALKILNVTLDLPGIECIRTEQVIPQFVQYFMHAIHYLIPFLVWRLAI